MPKINSKAKGGAAGERELSNLLKEHGYNTRRGTTILWCKWGC